MAGDLARQWKRACRAFWPTDSCGMAARSESGQNGIQQLRSRSKVQPAFKYLTVWQYPEILMAGKRTHRVRNNNPGKCTRPSERCKAGSVLPESRSARRCPSLTHSGGHKDPTSWHQNAATIRHCQKSPASRRLASCEDKATAVEELQTGIILRRGYPQETS